MGIMRKKSVVLLVVAILVTLIPQVSAGSAMPVFHGFSENAEMVISVDDELLWLSPENDVPAFSMPVTKVLFHPGAYYIYFTVDEQLWMSDYNYRELTFVASEMSKDATTQAMKNVLVISDGYKSKVFVDGSLTSTIQSLLLIEAFNENSCLLTKDGQNGALVLNVDTGEVIGECDEDSQFSFVGDYIVSILGLGIEARIRSYGLNIVHSLEVGGAYFFRGSHIFRRFNESVYIIDPDNPREQQILPRFKHSFISDDLLVGITEGGEYLALELPSLAIRASNGDVNCTTSWIWFKDYDDGIIANMGNQGGVINKDSGQMDIINCAPISGCDDYIFCANEDGFCFLNVSDGIMIDTQIEADNACIVSHCGETCNLLLIIDETMSIANIDITSGVLLSQEIVGMDFYIAGAPRTTSLSEPLNFCDVASINSLKNDGFEYASPVFISGSSANTALVFQPGKKSPRIYISPVSLR